MERTIETADIKYIFLDVVGFTKRSVDAQADVVESLNKAVRNALSAIAKEETEERIAVPTGDGMAIALIHCDSLDAHLTIACEILQQVYRENHRMAPMDPSRVFEVRIGLNENRDNIVLDINGKRNVAGAGVSMAQRIMTQADGGQILIGQSVYDRLQPRERYMNSFRTYQARGKHGISFPVHQFLLQNVDGFNNGVPSVFATKEVVKPKFSKLVAFYVAHALRGREFFLSKNDDPGLGDTAPILLFLLAEDSVAKAETPPHEKPSMHTWKSGDASIAQQYDHYDEMDSWIRITLAGLIQQTHLESFAEFFETWKFGDRNYGVVRPTALEKLRDEWPAIAVEFELES